jgi:hypothetical protein
MRVRDTSATRTSCWRWSNAGVALVLGLAACAPSVAPALDVGAHRISSFRAMDASHARRIELDGFTSVRAAGQAAAREIGLGCTTVFVWGEVASIQVAKPVVLVVGGHELEGVAVCEADMEAMLRAQLENPKLDRGGQSADLVVSHGEFWLRRRWMSAMAPLGQLDVSPSRVIQRDELLAVILDADDDARAATVLPALARAPRYFLFGMWILL